MLGNISSGERVRRRKYFKRKSRFKKMGVGKNIKLYTFYKPYFPKYLFVGSDPSGGWGSRNKLRAKLIDGLSCTA